MLALITGIVGLLATLAAWFLNPRRVLYAEIDQVYKDLEADYVKRDKALAENDSANLTIITADIIRLAMLKEKLLKRLG